MRMRIKQLRKFDTLQELNEYILCLFGFDVIDVKIIFNQRTDGFVYFLFYYEIINEGEKNV